MQLEGISTHVLFGNEISQRSVIRRVILAGMTEIRETAFLLLYFLCLFSGLWLLFHQFKQL